MDGWKETEALHWFLYKPYAPPPLICGAPAPHLHAARRSQ